jgi:hypothetical protein
VLWVSPLLALAHEQAGKIRDAFGEEVELFDGNWRPTVVVLGNSSDKDFAEDGVARTSDLAARRDASLQGDDSQGLAVHMRRGGQLERLFDMITTLPRDGQNDVPLFVMLSPEKLALSLETCAFLGACAGADVLGFMIVDEVHCVVEHGLDFRPEYLDVGDVRTTLGLSVLGLTATASPSTAWAICESLRISPHSVYVERSPTGSLRSQMTYELLPIAVSGAGRAPRSHVLLELLYGFAEPRHHLLQLDRRM